MVCCQYKTQILSWVPHLKCHIVLATRRDEQEHLERALRVSCNRLAMMGHATLRSGASLPASRAAATLLQSIAAAPPFGQICWTALSTQRARSRVCITCWVPCEMGDLGRVARVLLTLTRSVSHALTRTTVPPVR